MKLTCGQRNKRHHSRSLANWKDKKSRISFCIYQAYKAVRPYYGPSSNYRHKDMAHSFQYIRTIQLNKNHQVAFYPLHCDKMDNAYDCDSN